MNYELKQYSFGETIGKAFNLYFNNFITVVLVSLLCQAPLVLMMKAIGMGDLAQGRLPLIGPGYFVKIAVFWLASIIVGTLVTAYIINLVAKKFLDNSSLTTDLQMSSVWAKVLPLIGLSLLVGLVTVLWTFLLVIPGIIAMLSYSVATAVLVLEKQSITQAMKRSKILTKGKKWRILGLFIVIGIIIYSINQSLILLLSILKLVPMLMFYLSKFISALTAPLYYCLLVVIYFNLRIEKEGFNIEHLAQQFSLADPTGQGLTPED